jgi:ribulose 1,5-bisphosphate carboxylase large subunit-like protein
MDGYLTVRGVFRLDEPVSKAKYFADVAPAFAPFLNQIRADALTGTFGDFNQSIFATPDAFKAFQARSAKLAKVFNVTDAADGPIRELKFELQLACDAFAAADLGMQKLVHVLVSDLFERRAPVLDGRVEIADVDLGPLDKVFSAAYRPKSHSIAAIRQAFELEPDEPLLAFTLKPRSALTLDDYLHLARDAFEGGCQIVEMDTRDLDVAPGTRMQTILELSKRALAASQGKRPRRFSVNLSGPLHAIKDTIQALSDLHKQANTPCWVVKIDGNLDGLSTIQAIRQGALPLHSQPIVTCYPVLKYGLQRYLGRDTFVRLLTLSGADIIYPGARPEFRGDKAIDGAGAEQYTHAKRHYEKMRTDGYPLLSVAGGISIGHVHATVALLGVDIAFFVGGGLALSHHDVEKAAKNFKTAIDYARKDVKLKDWDGQNFAKRYGPLTLVYADKDIVAPDFEYVDPRSLLKRGVEMTYRPDGA